MRGLKTHPKITKNIHINFYKNIYKNVQRGFTLLELLIAIVIATLLAMATWISFSATNNANNNQTAVSDIRDNAFYILDRFEHMVRHAGFIHYGDGLADLMAGQPSIISFPDQFNKSNTNQQNDQFAINLNIPSFNNQEMVGCTGAVIPPGASTDVFTLRLYAQGNAAQTQLLCSVLRNGAIIGGGGPAVVAQNIARFKVFYRETTQQVTPNGDLAACGENWKSAQAIGSDFSKVCAVHLSLVALSDQRVLQSVTQNIQIAPDLSSQNQDTLITIGANKAPAPLARFVPKTIQTRNQ
jgi:prepilin-type N-terminal cleavage/methylation domain-containing protein